MAVFNYRTTFKKVMEREWKPLKFNGNKQLTCGFISELFTNLGVFIRRYKCSNSKTLRSTLQPLFPTHPSKVVGDTNKSYELLHDQSAGNSSGVPHHNDVEMSNCLQDNASMVVDQPEIPEFSFPIPQVGLVSFTGPRFDSQCFQHGQDFPPFYKTSISTPVLSPKLACRAESCSPMNTASHTNPNMQGCHQSEEDATNMAVERAKHEVLEQEEDTELDSPTTGQSESHVSNNATGSVCGTTDGNALPTVVAVENATTSQSLNNRGQVVHEVCRGMDAFRSKHREAALAKFRMKRKDRRFEKKVWPYHSKLELYGYYDKIIVFFDVLSTLKTS